MSNLSGVDPRKYLISGTDPDAVTFYPELVQRAQHATYALIEPDVVILDTETTGLSPNEDSLIEIAAIRMQGTKRLAEFQTFVNPGFSIPDFITELTSITDDDVKDAPRPAAAVAELEKFAQDALIVAHNAKFDREFIAANTSIRSYLSNPDIWIDSLSLSRVAFPRLIAHDQATLCKAFGIEAGNHRAIGDVRALASLWRIMLAALNEMPHELLSFIFQLAPEATWPVRDAIAILLSDEDINRPFSMHRLRDKRIRQFRDLSARTPAGSVSAGSSPAGSSPAGHALAGSASADSIPADSVSPGPAPLDPIPIDPAENDINDLLPVDTAEIEQAFSEDGIVGKMYDSFERRPEQVQFATEVANAFYTSTHRLIEAGTGVGKSVAYLLPAVMFAIRNNVRVGIATRSNTLLDQLLFDELPALEDTLAQSGMRSIKSIALKGYDHYPCLRKLMRYARSMGADATDYDITTVATVLAQIAQSTWGDLDSLTLTPSHAVRSGIVCTSEECMHSKCSYYPRRCLLHGARRRAFESQVIVTNHALLFRDISMDNSILPPIRYWIIDEAHGMEEEARRQFSHSVSAKDMLSLMHKLDSPSGPVLQIQEKAMLLEGGNSLMGSTGSIRSKLAEVRELITSFFKFVKDLGELVPSSSYATSDIWINEEKRQSPQWKLVTQTGAVLVESLSGLAKDCANAVSMTEQFDEISALTTELSSIHARLSEALVSISLVIDGSQTDYYYYAHVHSDPEKLNESLVAALVDPGYQLATRLFMEQNSLVMSSATLTVGGSFDFFAHRVGLDRLEDGLWEACSVEPSEGFYSKMHTFVVSDMPEQRDSRYLDAMAKMLIDAHLGAGGGVLTLFTNRREMQELYRRVSPVLKEAGIELFCQLGGRSKRMLSEEFTSKEDSCLFAMRSFWEGFDAPGRTLRCVILPKLPFSRPDDPLYQEMNTRRKDVWKTFVLPQAVIDTRQAAGRLIRSRSDSGALILADSRLTTKWYGKVFLKSLAGKDVEIVSENQIQSLLEKIDF